MTRFYAALFSVALLMLQAAFCAGQGVEWATYYGTQTTTSGKAVACDAQGNVYFAGFTSSEGMATQGSHQTTKATNNNIQAYLAKFNAQGQRMWATYYSGINGGEEANAVVCDEMGNVYVSGSAYSANGISTPGSHQETFGGGRGDAFLVKFSSQGQRLWGTYYGGGDQESGDGLALDGQGNVYLAGHSWSSNAIATPGSHQSAKNGIISAYLVKFNPLGQRQWATYYSGNRISSSTNSVACDAQGNVYLAGSTDSDAGIATAGTYQETCAAGGGAFLVKFNGQGQRLWATYYCGVLPSALACDGQGTVYIGGMTAETVGIASPGAHQVLYGGYRGDAFLAKFTSDGQREWATYYGGTFWDFCQDITLDPAGNVFMTGYTSSPDGIATTGSRAMPAGSGWDDIFLVKFDSQGHRLWGAYYGDGENDRAHAMACDGQGTIYVTGITHSKTGIATQGSFQDANTSRYGTAFMMKWRDGGATTAARKVASAALQVRPNPTSALVAVTGLTDEPAFLLTLDGKVLLTLPPGTYGAARIDLSPYPAGQYVLRQGEATVRVVKR